MRQIRPSLDDLRREIDRIDDSIHDLLIRRIEIAEQIGRTKTGINLRPGREASILRRLAARHKGHLPFIVVARIWRELFGAGLCIQGPFAIAVHVPQDKRSALWDVARDHYGSATPMQVHSSSVSVIGAVMDGTVTAGVLAWPEDSEPDPWWRHLLSKDPKTPRVVARLPFARNSGSRNESQDALAIARIINEPTGNDCTLIGVELTAAISRSRLKKHLDDAGFEVSGFHSLSSPTTDSPLHLIEVAGYVPDDDPRLATLSAHIGDALTYLAPVGGYAVPLEATSETREA